MKTELLMVNVVVRDGTSAIFAVAHNSSPPDYPSHIVILSQVSPSQVLGLMYDADFKRGF